MRQSVHGGAAACSGLLCAHAGAMATRCCGQCATLAQLPCFPCLPAGFSPACLPACLWRRQVGSIANFSAVYLLAPVAVSAGGAARQGLFQKLFGSYFLNRWGAPGALSLQQPAPAAAWLNPGWLLVRML